MSSAFCPQDLKHECSDCGFRKWDEEFENCTSFDLVCNDCLGDQDEWERGEE
jgi:hypothetical protein